MAETSCRGGVQVFLKLDKADKDRLERQTAALDAARSLAAGDGAGDALGCLRQEQRRAVMDLYKLTAEVKARDPCLCTPCSHLLRIS